MIENKRKNLAKEIHDAFKDTPPPENGYVGSELEEFGQIHWCDV